MVTRALTLLGVLAAGVSALQASTQVLTFEGLQDNEAVLNYYNGGNGGNGSGPGPNYGITFGADSMALISNVKGGTGNFDGNPSGDTIVYFLSGPGDVMNVTSGFTTGFSFFYSAVNSPGSVSVFSGANGAGTQLATLTLPVVPSGEGTGSCNSTDQYCPWAPIGVTFSGTAQSVVFSGASNGIGFDNITLGSSVPVVSPEPSSLILLGSGVGALALAALRKRKAA